MVRRSGELVWADPALLILESLVTGPKHGYAIAQDAEEGVGVRLGPGTLYAALARLEQKGHVRALPGEDRRRPYEITASGAAVLSARLEAMSSFATRGLARLKAAST